MAIAALVALVNDWGSRPREVGHRQEPAIDLAQIAARHELSGGMIMNVIRYASMQAISRGETVLRQHDLLDGIRREFAKENRLE